jgi:hypothetical protein
VVRWIAAATLGATYGFHRAGTDVRLLELLQLLELLLLAAISDFLAFSFLICHFFMNASEFLRG